MLEKLTVRQQYLAVNRTDQRVAAKGLVVQKGPQNQTGAIRVGLTVTKKVGNAVERNRVKRRLRELIKQVMPPLVDAGYDYVVVGRRAALTRDYEGLVKDMTYACHKLRNQNSKSRTVPKQGRADV